MYKNWEVTWTGELSGTPRQIWDGFTRHAAAYLWPVTYEPRVGGAENGLTNAGGTVTVWEPERHFRTEARKDDGWFNWLDYTLDGNRLTIVHRTCVPEEEFDVQYDACVQHTRLYNHTLSEYVARFAGREAHYLGLDEVPGSTAGLLARLGVPDTAGPGDRVALGVLDYRDGTMVGIRGEDAFYRVYGRDAWGWPVGFAVHSFDGPVDEAAWREKVMG
jgi:hypothetical protein